MRKTTFQREICFAHTGSGNLRGSPSWKPPLREKIMVLLGPGLLAVCGLLFAGCVSPRYQMIDKEKRQPQVELGVGAATDSLEVELHTVIYYEGPGSWKTMADWDEYVFSVRNSSDVPVELTAIVLDDPRGDRIESGSVPWVLVTKTKKLEKEYKKAGIRTSRSVDPSFLEGTAATGALAGIELGAIAATEALWVAAIGGSTLAAGAVIALPVFAVVAVPVYIVNNQNGKRAVETEFGQRRLAMPYTIPPNEMISGSVFFPVVPTPQAIRVMYRRVDAPSVQEPSILLVGEGKFDKLHVEFDG